MIEPEKDDWLHERGCPEFNRGGMFAEPENSHVDLFCDCHRFTEPKILRNGTDIAWPAGWTEEQARQWRGRHNLIKPETQPAT